MFDALHNSLLSLIYPQDCRVCSRQVESRADGAACSLCWEKTSIFSGKEMLCDKCGAFFSPDAAPILVRCHQCDDHHYDKAAAIGIYENALAASVLELKTVPVLRKRLKTHFPPAIERTALASADIIIPIPLSRRRQLDRGFNQAEVIADEIARLTRIPIDNSTLSRKLHTPIHRVAMDNKARELSVRNAFEVKRPKLIAGKNILLVDDVFTSGATASHCAKILKKNGATGVFVFTLARAVMD